ncbi:hypothetical protein BPT24_018 [Tenacibaculum phage pT24]|uniref:Uncharacterized protein n=1 Tax=Tenacibaculum phage pT24 TaxID=1880590 RepID=A0A1B4XWE9_9CAUD|nr:hypothetical protein HYP10_gp018 [Tenacibaculum phage pT24]BAV39140.1 hypothetical protein BPT24_018 [Tenacibaculum phage pT24]
METFFYYLTLFTLGSLIIQLFYPNVFKYAFERFGINSKECSEESSTIKVEIDNTSEKLNELLKSEDYSVDDIDEIRKEAMFKNKIAKKLMIKGLYTVLFGILLILITFSRLLWLILGCFSIIDIAFWVYIPLTLLLSNFFKRYGLESPNRLWVILQFGIVIYYLINYNNFFWSSLEIVSENIYGFP